jgi:hypothetical protein
MVCKLPKLIMNAKVFQQFLGDIALQGPRRNFPQSQIPKSCKKIYNLVSVVHSKDRIQGSSDAQRANISGSDAGGRAADGRGTVAMV